MEQTIKTGASLMECLNTVKRRSMATGQRPNLTSVAEAAGINRGTVSRIAAGLPPKGDQADRLWAALKEIGMDADRADQPDQAETTQDEPWNRPFEPDTPERGYKRAVELYETKQYKDAMGWCEYIRDKRKMGVMIGHPGSGKTTILKQFCGMTGARYIECWSTMRMGDLLSELAAAAGTSLSGNIYNRTRQVIRALSGRENVVLVFDEAEQLRKWDVDKFETMRKIWDNTGTPVIFAGTTQLRNLLTRGGGKDNLAQLYRRKYEFELTGISGAEVRDILRDYSLTGSAAEELTRIATDARHGGMGNFVELLGLCLDAADGERIDAATLEGAKHYKMLY